MTNNDGGYFLVIFREKKKSLSAVTFKMGLTSNSAIVIVHRV